MRPRSCPSKNTACVPCEAFTTIDKECTALVSIEPLEKFESALPGAPVTPSEPNTRCLLSPPYENAQSFVPGPELSEPRINWPLKKLLPLVVAGPLALKVSATVKFAGDRLFGVVLA